MPDRPAPQTKKKGRDRHQNGNEVVQSKVVTSMRKELASDPCISMAKFREHQPW